MKKCQDLWLQSNQSHYLKNISAMWYGSIRRFHLPVVDLLSFFSYWRNTFGLFYCFGLIFRGLKLITVLLPKKEKTNHLPVFPQHTVLEEILFVQWQAVWWAHKLNDMVEAVMNPLVAKKHAKDLRKTQRVSEKETLSELWNFPLLCIGEYRKHYISLSLNVLYFRSLLEIVSSKI